MCHFERSGYLKFSRALRLDPNPTWRFDFKFRLYDASMGPVFLFFLPFLIRSLKYFPSIGFNVRIIALQIKWPVNVVLMSVYLQKFFESDTSASSSKWGTISRAGENLAIRRQMCLQIKCVNCPMFWRQLSKTVWSEKSMPGR